MLNKYTKLLAKRACLLSILFVGLISAAAPDTENYFDKLPPELLEKIVGYMDVNIRRDFQALARLRQTSRYWREYTNKIISPIIERADLLIIEDDDYSVKKPLEKAIWNVEPYAVKQRLIFLRAQFLIHRGRDNGLYRAILDKDSISILRILIKNGVDIKSTSNNFLHTALKCNNISAASFLIANGADINAVDKSGRTVKQYAESSDNPELIKFFRKAEEKINGVRPDKNPDVYVEPDWERYELKWNKFWSEKTDEKIYECALIYKIYSSQ
jgi:hypothetical protein